MQTNLFLKTLMVALLIAQSSVWSFAQSTSLFSENAAAAQRTTANPKVQYLALQPAVLAQAFRQKNNTLQLDLPYKGEVLRLDLTKVNVLSSNFYILQQTANGIDTLPYQAGVYYRGTVSGAQGKSVASVSIFQNEVMATFSDARGNFTLGAMVNTLPNGRQQNDALNYVLYNTNEVQNPNPADCFTDSHAPDGTVQGIAQSTIGQRTAAGHDTVRIYLEADHTLYNYFGTTAATANYVTSIFNAVATLYANEQITLQLAPVFVWATPDPYYTFFGSVALSDFKARRTTFDGDQAQLLSLNGNGGIAAGFNTFCTDNRYSFSGIKPSFDALPAYSWTINVVAHEFGHCFGSRHTHWCGWQGGAIDGCSGNLEPAPNGSMCSPLGFPTAGGTIMSYCHNRNVGTNLANGFGQQPGDRIRFCVNNRSCSSGSITGNVTAIATGLPYGYTPFWSLDGGPFLSDIDVAANVSEGQHTVAFANIIGGNPPLAQIINVVRGQTTVVTVNYNAVPGKGRVTVNLTGGGGQGRWTSYDFNSVWQASGDTTDMYIGFRSIDFKDITGWAKPATVNITVTENQLYTINAVYTPLPTGKITAHLNGGGSDAQWLIYQGNDFTLNDGWHNSDDTTTINANALYTIFYKEMADWIAPPRKTIYTTPNQLKKDTVTYVPNPSGYIKVNISGANGQGQWSLYPSTVWRNSGDSVLVQYNQYSTNVVVFKSVSGWAVPDFIYGNITPNTTNVFNVAYRAPRYTTVKVNLTGDNGNGRWILNNETTQRNSGDTIHLIANEINQFTLQALALSGYQLPLNITAYNQRLDSLNENVFTLNYNAIRQAKIRVNLSGANSNGQWTTDNMTWHNSGDSAQVFLDNLPQAYQTIYFKNVNGWISPTAMNVNNSDLSLQNANVFTSAYRQIAYRTLKVELMGGDGNGQYRVRGNVFSTASAWRNSGDTLHLSNLNAYYTVEYKNVTDWQKPNNDDFAWSAMPTATTQSYLVAATYTPVLYGLARINLGGGNGAGQWRLEDTQFNTFTAWQNSGDTIRRALDAFSALRYRISFKPVNNWDTPQQEVITFAPNHQTSQTFYYTLAPLGNPAQLQVLLAGGNNIAQWSLNDAVLRNSADTVAAVVGQSILIHYESVAGWLTPNDTTVWIGSGINKVIAAYRPITQGELVVNINGANGQGRWTTLNNTTLYASGDTAVLSLSNSTFYDIQFIDVPNWIKPNIAGANLSGGNPVVLDATYTPASLQTLKVNIIGANGLGKWRVYNLSTGIYSAWRNTADTLHLYNNLQYRLEYKTVSGWILPYNNNATVTFDINNTTTVYTGVYNEALYATIRVYLVGDNGLGKWYGNNFVQHNSGDTIHQLINNPVGGGTIYINFTNVTGLITPSYIGLNPSTLHTNVENVLYAEYEPPTTYFFKNLLVGANGLGQWQANNNGVWLNSGDSIALSANTTHTIRYKNVVGWYAPADYTFQIQQDLTSTGNYIAIGEGIVQVNLTGAGGLGQWRTNYGGTWKNSGDTLHIPVYNNAYTVYYKNINGWLSPNTDWYNPVANQTTVLVGNYTTAQEGVLAVNLVGGGNQGMWSIRNNEWLNSGDTLHLSTTQTYNIAFRTVSNWLTPNGQNNVALTNGQTTTQTGIYFQLIGVVRVNLTGGGGAGRWSADNGITWRVSGDTSYLVANRLTRIQYKNVANWQTPAFFDVSPIAGQLRVVNAAYTPLQYGTLRVDFTGANGQGQWRINSSSVWHNSGDTLHLPSGSTHTIVSKNVANWQSPGNAPYTALANQTTVFVGNYTPIPIVLSDVLTINIIGGNNQGQWRANNSNVWRNSGDTLHVVAGTTAYIYFKSVTGWNTAYTLQYLATGGQTATLVGEYRLPENAKLTVDIVGGNGQGRWSIDGQDWRVSGDTLNIATYTSYNIQFRQLNGFYLPNTQFFSTPIANQTTTLTGTYIAQPFSVLEVNLTGANGQGLWSTDQLVWHASGDTVHLYTTEATVYFKPVANWIKPNVQYISLDPSQTTTTLGEYTLRSVGTEVNTPQFEFSIMPNPASDFLRCVSKSSDINTPLELRFYNTLGTLLYKSSLSANDEHRLDTSIYPAGFYILQLYDPQTKAFVAHKVMIQH
jgi:Metallo-peptidase family M12